jgi:hypothetical protein
MKRSARLLAVLAAVAITGLAATQVPGASHTLADLTSGPLATTTYAFADLTSGPLASSSQAMADLTSGPLSAQIVSGL